MKKNYLFSLMALFVLLFAACNSEEIVSGLNENKGPVTLNVGIPVNNPVTRVAPTIPQGFALRCIMQLVDQSGSAIDGERYVKEVPSGAESVTFTFNIPSNYGGAMFWADYVKKGDATEIANVADHLYTTTDLTSVVYNTANIATLFNNDAADAFAGYMQSGTTSIALKRPFTKLTFKTSAENYKDYTTISVTELPAPTSYNVKSGLTTNTATGIASGEMAITDGVWFSTYLFVGSNNANMGEGNDIEFTLKKEDGTSVDLLMPGKDITLTENYNVTVDITPSESNDQEVTVTFPSDMVDPNKPQAMAIGDYINKDGSYTKTYNADNAVAIVFAVGAQGDDVVANYGTGFEGKTIAGYAMALSNVAGKPFASADGLALPTDDQNLESYSGIKLTETLQKYIADNSRTSALFGANFDNWKTSNEVTGTNLSSWYIPSFQQLATFIGRIYGQPGTDDTSKFPTSIAKDATFEAAVQAASAGDFLAGGASKNLMTCSCIGTAQMACVQFTSDGFAKAFNLANLTNSTVMRPVLTVFAAE